MAAGDLSQSASGLILTLELDGAAFAELDTLRRRLTPPERNRVPAHLSMFGHLPRQRARDVKAIVGLVAGQQRPIDIPAGELRVMESGVGVFVHAPQLHALHDRLARELGSLAEANEARFHPHVTIQVGVGDREAEATLRQLRAENYRPPRMRGEGLHLWRYREDGHWESNSRFRFG